jgi:HTH-type transcriptional regulator / antitoxin HigA
MTTISAPTPPGATLQDELSAHGITQASLATRIGLSAKHINQIIKGTAPITPDTALKLEHILDVKAGFWLQRESDYREALARLQERSQLEGELGWIKALHADVLAERGFIPQSTDKIQTLLGLLKFFRIPAFDNFSALTGAGGTGVAFRAAAAHRADPYAVVTWLRACETRAEQISTKPYDDSTFRASLHTIRKLTRDTNPANWIPTLIDLCAAAGVALVIEPTIGKTLLNGAAWWPSPEKAIIALTGRSKRADIFWFTFFHEAAHITLHSKKQAWVDITEKEQSFLEANSKAEIEREADQFAANRLVPAEHDIELRELVPTKASINDFAERLEIGADVVLGRLQHDGRIAYGHPLGKLAVPVDATRLAALSREHVASGRSVL